MNQTYSQENQHTPPSDWCPHPEYWHSVDGMATEQEVSFLLWGLVRALQPDVVVETGAYRGDSSVLMGKALRSNGHGHLWAIEHSPLCAHSTTMRCQALPVTVVQGESLDWTPPAPIDLAFLDSDILTRPLEVKRFWPYFRPGATVAIHDTAPHHRNPEHLQELCHGLGYLNLRTPRGLMLFQVPA